MGRSSLAGLKCLQGKGIVNSISAQGGRGDLPRATARDDPALRRGPSVVMAFDEERAGPRPTPRKSESARRAYRILVDELAFPPEDIIFDPNILTVATGIEGSTTTTRSTSSRPRGGSRANLPHAKVSGGRLERFRFSFSRQQSRAPRPCTRRSSITRFKPAMDMGIVNAGMLEVYEEIEPELRGARGGCPSQSPARRDGAARGLRREAEKPRAAVRRRPRRSPKSGEAAPSKHGSLTPW